MFITKTPSPYSHPLLYLGHIYNCYKVAASEHSPEAGHSRTGIPASVSFSVPSDSMTVLLPNSTPSQSLCRDFILTREAPISPPCFINHLQLSSMDTSVAEPLCCFLPLALSSPSSLHWGCQPTHPSAALQISVFLQDPATASFRALILSLGPRQLSPAILLTDSSQFSSSPSLPLVGPMWSLLSQTEVS